MADDGVAGRTDCTLARHVVTGVAGRAIRTNTVTCESGAGLVSGVEVLARVGGVSGASGRVVRAAGGYCRNGRGSREIGDEIVRECRFLHGATGVEKVDVPNDAQRSGRSTRERSRTKHDRASMPGAVDRHECSTA